nr:MAG TPA: hypothetical protein [Caudoviricetes sp.]
MVLEAGLQYCFFAISCCIYRLMHLVIYQRNKENKAP